MTIWYGLDGTPITVEEAEKLLVNMAARRIGLDEKTVDGVTIILSTVFLVLDHKLGATAGPPSLFETMIFLHPDEDTRVTENEADQLEKHPAHNACWRYPTKTLAEIGHATLNEAIQQATTLEDLTRITEIHL